MRLVTLDRATEITSDLFLNYVEHVGLSMMSGELPSVLFSIHRRGSAEKDWLALVKFKNTLTISVFRCDVYFEDVFRLCRMCKLWLITEDVLRVSLLYAMLHPLYQSQFIDFKVDVNADYNSMMASAGIATYNFISQCYKFASDMERLVLEIYKTHMEIFTNHTTPDTLDHFAELQNKYHQEMLKTHPGAYRASRYRKGSTALIDEDGYLILEHKTPGGIYYNSDEGG